MRIFWFVVVLAALFGGIVRAEAPLPAPQAARLTGALPAGVLKRLRAAPDRFVADAAGLIYGFGQNGAIGQDGITAYVALERAKVRAREVARMLAADLDADGTVTSAEAAVLAASLSARDRARLKKALAASDANADGTADLTEMRMQAQAAALAAMTDTDADEIAAILAFDLDADGSVTPDEVIRGVDVLEGEGG
jgi:Ca2+-binding EF-hand superfamily protein